MEQYIERNKFKLLSLLTIFIVCRKMGSLQYLYFITPFFLLLTITNVIYIGIYQKKIIEIWQRKKIFIIILFAYPIYTLLTTLWSVYPWLTFQRSLYILLLYAGFFAVSILIQDWDCNKFIKLFLPANIFLIIVSIVTLNLADYGLIWTVNFDWEGFKGLYGHSNVYAAALLFTLIGVTSLFPPQKRLKIGNEKFNLQWLKDKKLLSGLILSVTNIFFIIISYSRTTMISLLIGALVFLFLIKNIKTLIMICIGIIIFIAIILANGQMEDKVIKYALKGSGNFFDHRIVLFEPSLKAAKLGGIFGFGLGVSAPNIRVERPYKVDEPEIFIREKGNSTLAIIEETGMIGLILFLTPVFLVLYKLIWMLSNVSPNISNYIKPTLLISIIFTLLIHSQFESWWIWVGSPELHYFLFLIIVIFIKDMIEL